MGSICFNPKREARPSQTPSCLRKRPTTACFNPKREARPSQTLRVRVARRAGGGFQSQTGSQALSDGIALGVRYLLAIVSIPNGKPGPLRRQIDEYRTRKPEKFQSQTGSQALSDGLPERGGEVIPVAFQSQTGSQALSDAGRGIV